MEQFPSERGGSDEWTGGGATGGASGGATGGASGGTSGGARGGVRHALAWGVIVLCVVVVLMLHAAGPEEEEAGGPPAPADVSSADLRFLARMTQGMRTLSGEAATKGMVGQVRGAVGKGESDSALVTRLRGVVAIAEAGGAEAALESARALLEELDARETEAERAADADGVADAAGGEGKRGEEDAEAEAAQRAEYAAWNAEIRRDALALVALYEGRRDALGADDASRLVDRHGWFGRLALTWGAPDADPDRRAFAADGVRVLVGVVVMFGILGAGIVAGFVLFVLGAVRFMTGRMRMRMMETARLPSWDVPATPLLTEAFALFLVGMLVVGQVSAALAPMLGENIRFVLIWLLLGVVLWPLAFGESWLVVRAQLGWHAGRGPAREVLAGIGGYLAGLPIVGVGIGVTLMLMFVRALLVGDEEAAGPITHPIQEMLGGGVWRTVLMYSLACLWAPIVEETVFRGALYAGVRQRVGVVLSVLTTAFVFAVIHPQGWFAVPALMSLAVVFALIREWRGSIIGPIVAHALNNGFVITLLILVFG